MFLRSRLVTSLAVVAVLALSTVQAHAADTPGNDSCGTASTLPPPWGTGSLDGTTDTTDFYSLSASANDQFWIEMNPAYPPDTGKNYDLYLYNPGCSVVASSTYAGNTIESIKTYVASSSGTYYVEVRRVTGAGLYDLAAFAGGQGPKSCSSSATPGVLSVSYASCPLGSQTCASGSCTFKIKVEGGATGVVSTSYHGVQCTGPLSCSQEQTFTSGTFSDTCTSALGVTAAATVNIKCTVTLL